MFTISKDADINYLAKVVEITNLRPHGNADKLQLTDIGGYTVITGLTCEVGQTYIFFPVESTINSDYLAWSNSYEDKSLNQDKTLRGFFHKSSRVRACKLRGLVSQGYIVPIKDIVKFFKEVHKKQLTDYTVGEEFDTVFGIRFSGKYERPTKQIQGVSTRTKGNLKKYASKVIEGQFKFHVKTTPHLQREIGRIYPDDVISITVKYHGSNFCVSNVLTKKKLSWKERVAKWFGVKVVDTEYDVLWASRAVVKNAELNPNPNHFYGSDIWGSIKDIVAPKIKPSISIYGEVLNQADTGRWVQTGYDYGYPEKTPGYVVFRATYTNSKGDSFDFTWPQLQALAKETGLNLVHNLYYGPAKDLFPELSITDHWHENFLQALKDKWLETDCWLCKNKVPFEGICVNLQGYSWECFKLKGTNFIERESKCIDTGDFGLDEEIPTQEQNAINN